MLAIGKTVDISFPESGYFTRTADNRLIWRAIIIMEGVKGIGLYYDRFKLPEGVRYFIRNENSKQILGAYTQGNNTFSGTFAHEPVQGERAYVEMDLDAGVNPEDIQLHINKAACYFRGVDYLSAFRTSADEPVLLNFYDSLFVGINSVCMINSACPVAASYVQQSQSALSIIIPDENNESFGICSATMLNNTGNSPASCKNYMLTASHCDYSNSMAKDRFNFALFRFNYEQPSCYSNSIPEAKTLMGASFVARSDLDTVNFQMKGDFLLLRVNENIPESWNVVLAGWNRAGNIALVETAPEKFISFHHPGGMSGKFLSRSRSVPSSSAMVLRNKRIGSLILMRVILQEDLQAPVFLMVMVM